MVHLSDVISREVCGFYSKSYVGRTLGAYQTIRVRRVDCVMEKWKPAVDKRVHHY